MDEKWEVRLGQLVKTVMGWAFSILDGPSGSVTTRMVPVDRFQDEGWVIVRALPDVTLYNESGDPLRGHGPALLLKRRKP